jgi:hypothetical protein
MSRSEAFFVGCGFVSLSCFLYGSLSVGVFLPSNLVGVFLPSRFVGVFLPSKFVGVFLPSKFVGVFRPSTFVGVFLPAWNYNAEVYKYIS